jgi:hypothetical protein
MNQRQLQARRDDDIGAEMEAAIRDGDEDSG